MNGAFLIRLGLRWTSLYPPRDLLQFSVISDGVWGVLEVKECLEINYSPHLSCPRSLSILPCETVAVQAPMTYVEPSTPSYANFSRYLTCTIMQYPLMLSMTG